MVERESDVNYPNTWGIFTMKSPHLPTSPTIFFERNKLASLEATLVRNSAHPLTYSLTDLLTGVKCRATSVAKNHPVVFISYLYKIEILKFYIKIL